ncbi:hypothetical protein KXD40_008869 [Peronospora effusa]|uniref:Uncharacterized protein n=1 Tax=Peronospora effusa TaxID=542832 RepID=A0A3R7VYJ7_9STRA|nr:hypothetical protein DD237_007961 [Peronospora effusa]UIZ21832.1 hypothetical protein KXD40_008869 [Peronospora effusa]
MKAAFLLKALVKQILKCSSMQAGAVAEGLAEAEPLVEPNYFEVATDATQLPTTDGVLYVT